MIADRSAGAERRPGFWAELRGRCLQCSECRGACWQVFEMATLPGVVLGAETRRA